MHQADHIDGAGADGFGADRAILNRCDQFVAAVARGSGHFQIKTCVDGGGGGARSEPIRHDNPVISPLITQNFGQEPMVFGRIGPIDFVIGRHDPPCPRLFHGILEWAQVHFTQRPFVDFRTHRGAFNFAFVAGEMFDGGGYAFVLQTLNVLHCQGGG